MGTALNAGPRATAIFLLVTAVLFAALLGVLSWRATIAGLAPWVLALAVAVGVVSIVLAAFFARGVGEGRL